MYKSLPGRSLPMQKMTLLGSSQLLLDNVLNELGSSHILLMDMMPCSFKHITVTIKTFSTDDDMPNHNQAKSTSVGFNNNTTRSPDQDF